MYGATKEDVVKLYLDDNFSSACQKSAEIYDSYKEDDEFLNIFAHSCLEADMVNRLVLPIIKLYKTEKARENAAYYSTILYQKKLLYVALIDGVDISYVNLPKTNYILSIIFEKFVTKDYVLKSGMYTFIDDNNSQITYTLSIETEDNFKKMFLRTYKNDKIVKTRTYW